MDETRPLPEDAAPQDTVAGARLGRYVLVRKIGAGGCGEVFVAYDPVLDRRLALKVLFGEGSTAWAREARMLAKVDHRHVVSVHDAGVHEGRGYLATELVDGPDLEAWLREQVERPAPARLLSVLIPIAEALGSAHARGIVHGDVKPANILVAAEGARITDFGVARAIDRDKHDQDGRWAGTPAYMAPEQLEGQPSDERSDQYAFCLTLWEAIFGAPTFGGDTTAAGSNAEANETALTARRATGPASLVALADARRHPPSTAPKLRGLDPAIGRALLRGLQPAPADRFPSMAALVEALDAAPARRTARRRMAAAGLGALGVVSVSIFVSSRDPDVCTGASDALAPVWNPSRKAAVVAALGAVDLPIAASETRSAVDALDAYATDWIAQHTEICRATSVRKEQSETVLDLRMRCMHRARKGLDSAVDVLIEPDPTVLKNAVRLVQSVDAPASCLDADRLSAGESEPIPAGQESAVEEISDALVEAKALQTAGRFSKARDVAEAAVVRARSVDHPPTLASALLRLGYGHLEANDMPAAGVAFEESLELGLEHGPPLVGIEAASVLAYWASNGAAGASAGAAYAQVGLSLIRKVDPESQLHAGVLTNLGVVRTRQSRYDDARALFQRSHDMLADSLGPTNIRTLDAIDNLALVDMERRDMLQAREGFELSLKLRRDAYGASHFSTVQPLSNLAQVHSYVGEFERATEYYEEAIALATATLGPNDVQVAANLVGLANVESKLGDPEAAAGHVDRALEIYRAVYGDAHPMIADALIIRGQLHFIEGNYAAAEPIYEEALRISKATMEPTHPQIAVCTERVALANVGLQRWEKAEAMFTEALAAFEASGVAPATQSVSLGQRGSVRIELGRLEEAAQDLDRAAQLQRERDGSPLPDDVLTYNALASAHRQLGHAAQAREAYGWSIDLAETTDVFPPDLAEARAGVAMLDYEDAPRASRAQLEAQLKIIDAAGPDYETTAASIRAFLADPS